MTRFIIRLRRWIVLATLILGIGAGVFGAGVGPHLSPGGFEVRGGQTERDRAVVLDKFGPVDPDVVVIVEPAREAPATVAQRIAARVRDASGVGQVRTLGDPGAEGYISGDRHSALVAISLEGDSRAKHLTLTRLEPLLEERDARILLGGEVQAQREAQVLAAEDLSRAELVTLPIIAIALLFVFRGVVAGFLPLLVGGLAIALSTAILRGLAFVTPVATLSVNVVTFLGLGLAVDYSLFIVHRYREELDAGAGIFDAVRQTITTSGKTVAFSAAAVACSMLALLLFPIPLLRSIGIGGGLVTLLAGVIATVFLPALLAMLGRRVDSWALLRRRKGSSTPTIVVVASRAVMRRPGIVALVVGALLLFLGSPILRLQTALNEAATFPKETQTGQVTDRLGADSGFAHLGVSPVSIAVEVAPEATTQELLDATAETAKRIRAMPGVVEVVSPVDVLALLPPSLPLEVRMQMVRPLLVEGSALIHVTTGFVPGSSDSNAFVRTLRSGSPQSVELHVVGAAAMGEEVTRVIAERLPLAILAVTLVTVMVLLLAFGGVFVAIKAVLMNALSLSVSLGILVWVFQDGRLYGLAHAHEGGPINPLLPTLLFAMVFGLSMDYELFLLSRIKESFDKTGDHRESVVQGIGSTAGLITSAAALLVIVVAGMAAGRILFMRELGTAILVAIVIDATIVRVLLVPATMVLVGGWNWWAPARFLRWWQRLGIGVDEAGTSGSPQSTDMSRPKPAAFTDDARAYRSIDG